MANVADDGAYSWTVEGSASTNCMIRVSDVDGDPFDTSETFTISEELEEFIDIISPTLGTVWEIGSTQTIQWNSSGTSGQLDIHISYDGGTLFSLIADSIADDGDYSWTVQGPASTSCRIMITDLDWSISVDSELFTISSEPVSTLLDMVSIAGGTFQMGSNSSWAYLFEQPVHSVTLSAFTIAKYEVTNQEMREVMQWAYDNGLVNATSGTVTNAEGDSEELLDLDDDNCEISFSGGIFIVENGKEDHPCVEVTWYGAQAFCNYLSDMEGLGRCISFSDWSCTWSANGYRLPTEAEWEYVCRAGTTTDYYSGNETVSGCDYDPNLNPIAWYCYNASSTQTVGQKQPNAWLLYDMSGNVFELCNDWYESYTSDAQTDPTGPSTGTHRIIRGGTWKWEAEYCRSSDRSYVANPDGSYDSVGLRPARR